MTSILTGCFFLPVYLMISKQQLNTVVICGFAEVDFLQRPLDWRAKTRKKQRKSHVQRAGISLSTMTQQPPLIYLTPTGFSQSGHSAASKSPPLPNIYSVVQLSIPNPSLAKRQIFLTRSLEPAAGLTDSAYCSSGNVL